MDHGIPREDLVERERRVDRRQTRLVAEEPAHWNVGLARLRELRPVLRDGRVDVELAALCQQVRARGRGALRRGEHEL